MWILSVFVPLAYHLHFSQAVKSSCMAPPVKLGDEATLSCHFETDISKHKHDVLVYLYKDNNEHPVVKCAWHDGEVKIHAVQGYRIEGHISDYLVIKITNVNDSNAGQYSCVVALSKDTPGSCTLKIIDSSVVAVRKDHVLHGVKSSCTVPPVRIGDEATLSCHFDDDLSKIQQDILVAIFKDNNEHPVVRYVCTDGQTRVQTMEGYRCEGKISDYLVIKVKNVSYSNAGQYSCLVSLSKEEPTACTLNIIESSQVSSDAPVVKDSVLQEHREADDTLHIVLGVLLGVFLFIFLTILLCAIYNGWIPKHCCTKKPEIPLINNSNIQKCKQDITSDEEQQDLTL